MVKSAKGRDVNMQALMLANQKTVALGNAKMNARGDILGKNGKVVKTREQVINEYNKNPKGKAITVPVTAATINKQKPQPPVKQPGAVNPEHSKKKPAKKSEEE